VKIKKESLSLERGFAHLRQLGERTRNFSLSSFVANGKKGKLTASPIGPLRKRGGKGNRLEHSQQAKESNNPSITDLSLSPWYPEGWDCQE